MERRGAGNVEGGNGEMVNHVEGEDEEWYVEGEMRSGMSRGR